MDSTQSRIGRCECPPLFVLLHRTNMYVELQLTERFLLTMTDFGFSAQAVHKELRDVYADSKLISANEQRIVSQLIFPYYEKWAKVLSGDLLTRTLLGTVPLVDDLFSDNLHDAGSRILALSRTLNASPRAMQGVQRNINISVMSVLSFASADAAKVRLRFYRFLSLYLRELLGSHRLRSRVVHAGDA